MFRIKYNGSFEDVDTIREELNKFIDIRGYVTVADFYNLVNLPHTDLNSNIGWTSIEDFGAVFDPVVEMYVEIKLPDPQLLVRTVDSTCNDIMKPNLTMNEYQKLAMRTCSIPYDNKKGRLYHAVIGLNSEAGEVAGILQKEYQGHEIDPEHLKKELGDCLWMIAEACDALDISMSEVAQMNIDKLRARYPEGFEVERSLNRAEGDI